MTSRHLTKAGTTLYTMDKRPLTSHTLAYPVLSLPQRDVSRTA